MYGIYADTFTINKKPSQMLASTEALTLQWSQAAHWQSRIGHGLGSDLEFFWRRKRRWGFDEKWAVDSCLMRGKNHIEKYH